MISDFYHELVSTINNILNLSIIGTVKLPEIYSQECICIGFFVVLEEH